MTNSELYELLLSIEKNQRALSSNFENIFKKVESLEEKFDNLKACPELRRTWIPRREVMDYLGYADTQISAITKKYEIATSEIGKRLFYSNASLLDILEKNKR